MLDWRLLPASEGLQEHNDCHHPAGSPEGGQFCSKGGDAISTFASVGRALANAGVPVGRFKRAGVTVPDGYQAGEPGFVVNTRQDFTNPAGPALVYVDHIGPRREAALARYRAILKAAGHTATLGQVKHYSNKQVLWVGKVPTYERRD